ncbi:MAG: MtnX-like HAD-IB family phosphatase [Syntrophomonas sp.]|nr:MtnX-like HAD-IB family phosphatase [Syntrophomonas sp.]
MNKKLMFFIDFDGTISREDMCCAMVTKFAREGWEEINLLWEAGCLSTEECAQRTLDLMTVEPEELDAFFGQVDIDNSFIDFVNWAEHQGYPISILSDGYDNYIKKVLTQYGLSITYYANHLEYEQGWRIKCLHLDKECKKCGVCKTELMQELIQPGYLRIYIGDGYSDICPAESADIVFAKDKLAHLCQERGITFYHYDCFYDVQRIVQELVGTLNVSGD